MNNHELSWHIFAFLFTAVYNESLAFHGWNKKTILNFPFWSSFFFNSCWLDITHKGSYLICKWLCSLDIANSVNYFKPLKKGIMDFMTEFYSADYWSCMWIHVKEIDNRGVLQTDVPPLSVSSTAEMLGRHQHVLAMPCVINLTALDRAINRGTTS